MALAESAEVRSRLRPRADIIEEFEDNHGEGSLAGYDEKEHRSLADYSAHLEDVAEGGGRKRQQSHKVDPYSLFSDELIARFEKDYGKGSIAKYDPEIYESLHNYSIYLDDRVKGVGKTIVMRVGAPIWVFNHTQSARC
jgi:hypothetical protein